MPHADKLAKRPATDLAKYDPEKGLKTIAVAEAAEKYFARAKDATKLEHAIRTKLEAQAAFVEWWDTKGPGTNHGGTRKISGLKSWPEGLPASLVVHRWRKRLADPGDFENTFRLALARYIRILEEFAAAHVAQNSGENEWYTPEAFIQAARLVLGEIDLDPASSRQANEIVRAAVFFSRADDGLTQVWQGRVWMNPPYAQPLIAQFAEKWARSIEARDISASIALVNNGTETEWFYTMAGVADAICFPHGRVRFWSPTNDSAAPLQGQALLYAGPERDRFASTFASFGFVLVRPV